MIDPSTIMYRIWFLCLRLLGPGLQRLPWRRIVALVTLFIALPFVFQQDLVTLRTYLRPVWPHGYQRILVSHSDLLPKIRHHHRAAAPPIFVLNDHTLYDANKDGEPSKNPLRNIPKIVHLMWKDEMLPVVMQKWVEKWKTTNSDWKVLFWTDESSLKFMKQYYPTLVHVYESLGLPVQKADLFRYVLMQAFGGVYADLDMEPLKSLTPIRDWPEKCIVNQEPPEHHQISSFNAIGRHWRNNYTLAGNAFMASRPGHPFMFFVLSLVTERSPLITHLYCNIPWTLYCTGPLLVTQAYMFYKWSNQKAFSESGTVIPSDDDVIMGDYRDFTPTFDTADYVIEILRKNCEDPSHLRPLGIRTCAELKKRNFTNAPIPERSFTNHVWFHTYFLKENPKTVHIREVLPDVMFFFQQIFQFSERKFSDVEPH